MSQQDPPAPDPVQGTSQNTADARELFYFVQGQQTVDEIWSVKVQSTQSVAALKRAIYENDLRNARFQPKDLILYKVDVDPSKCTGEFFKKFESGDKAGFEKLSVIKTVSSYWPFQSEKLHIFVELPASVTDDRGIKRKRDEQNELTTGSADFAPHCPTPISLTRAEEVLKETFAIFNQYLKDLATGRLDAYLNSVSSADKPKLDGIRLNRDPILLLHGIGKDLDEPSKRNRIEELSDLHTVHIFAVSGSGKTRLALGGLCEHWGLYISCRSTQFALASKDFEVATDILSKISTWEKGETDQAVEKSNAEAATRVFNMMLCARTFFLDQFIHQIPTGTSSQDARRRWVFAQVMPPTEDVQHKEDLFVNLLRALRPASTDVLTELINRQFASFAKRVTELFPNEDPHLSVVIDEAQVAADYLKNFHSTKGEVRPILRQMYRFVSEREGIFCGIILSGTGLSMEMAKRMVGSSSAKWMPGPGSVFTKVGRFTSDDSEQENYIHRYLSLSDASVSDQRLLKRMKYWLYGRYRPTASLMEIFLSSKDAPRHRTLTAFVKSLTGFTITDAEDLEDDEPQISTSLAFKIGHYGEILSHDHLFGDMTAERILLLTWLVDFIRQWTLGREPTIPINHDMHSMIALGIGFLGSGDAMSIPEKDTPVYISEPLVVLALRSLFEKQTWTTRHTWLVRSFCVTPSASSRGYIFEEAVLFLLMDRFGGKYAPLGDVFHCDGDLALRNVTLVALKRQSNGKLSSHRASWHSGCSDRVGVRAETPNDVLNFLQDPDGKVFLFPDNHMGPDLLCFLQDKKTGELIVLVVQAKYQWSLQLSAWKLALETLIPTFYYMQVDNDTGGRKQYAPIKHAGLIAELEEAFHNLVGPGVYDEHIANNRRMQFRSLVTPNLNRKTPPIIKIVAAPENPRNPHDTGCLKWEAMVDYFGQGINGFKPKER